jgi:CRISPR/Cas system endoribonuclease Cas6 (RAMP superfamily)
MANRKVKDKKYYDKHKEVIRAKRKLYYLKNKEKELERSKKWKAQHPNYQPKYMRETEISVRCTLPLFGI